MPAVTDTLLDIFVPYWGDPALMRRTIESVLAQRDDRWRLTVVDDAYPDPTIQDWIGTLEDERITYVRNETNRGITENYATCRALAQQDLVMFLGCDDVLHPNFVATVLDAAHTFPTAAIIQPGVDIIDEHDQHASTLVDSIKQRIARPRVDRVTELSGEPLAASLLAGNWMYWPSLVFRTQVVNAFDFRDELPIIQDLALVLDMVVAGESLVLVPTTCFSYRRHSQSASATTLVDGTRFAGDRRYFRIAAEQARALGWRRAERAARMRLLSRAHALSMVPGAMLRRGDAPVRPLLTHAFHR